MRARCQCPAAFFISHCRSPGAHPLLAAGLGVDAPLDELSEPLLVVPEPSVLVVFLRVPVYFGAAFFVASSVPVGGGLAALLGVGVGSAVCVGLGSGKGSGWGGGGGSGRKAIAITTIRAASAIPPPMKRPVLLFGGGIAKSAAVSGLGPPPNGEPPSGEPPSGAPRPPSGAMPRGAAPNGELAEMSDEVLA